MANKWALVLGKKGTRNEPIAGDNNARDMAAVLKSIYGFDSANIRMLLNNKFTRDSELAGIQWLIDNADAQSSVFFFYSGHGGHSGAIGTGGYGVIDYLRSIDLANLLVPLKYERLALVFECCFSGNMVADLAGPNRVVAASTRVDELGVSSSQSSPFSRTFIDEGMKQGLADTDGDGKVSVEEALAYYAKRTGEGGTLSDNYPNGLIP